MPPCRKYILALIWATIAGTASLFAQQSISDARKLAADKNYDKALEIYASIYNATPDSVYDEYLATLLTAGKYKVAEKVVEKKAATLPRNTRNAKMSIDLGTVYAKAGKPDKAKTQLDSVVNMVNGDDILTGQLAKLLTDAGRDDYAIAVYERALMMLGNPPMYGRQLATLHNRTGNMEAAIEALLRGGPSVFTTADAAKEQLLEMLGTDQEKIKQAQKILVKKINQEPSNNYYGEILTWIYTQKNDWDGALMQIEAIDERNKEMGRRIMDFARAAVLAHQYDAANKAFESIIVQGKEAPYYHLAKVEQLACMMTQLEQNHARTDAEVADLIKRYDTFLVEYPKQYTQKTASDFARLLAEYGRNTKRAVQVLQTAIAEPDTRRNMMGIFKLQLGDYYLLLGKVWDASLVFSQVEKDFKQDVMGEDARFRNARLAFYQGDFELAQKLLGILKSGTSNLIANDAIDLSVLITENVEDSVTLPLERFAAAGLLMFQNRDDEAEKLIDSIARVFPKHPLGDDLLMFRANLAIKHRNYTQALSLLADITKNYKEDVLGDDALYKTANIYYYELANVEEARKFYEQLIIDFPGSTYVQHARHQLAAIRAGATQ